MTVNKNVQWFCFGAALFFVINTFQDCIGGKYFSTSRPTPKTVTYREKVKELEDGGEVWKTAVYNINDVRTDTVYPDKAVRSTLEDWHPKAKTPIIEERVDLNDYLGHLDPLTDWNYTDYGDYEEKILKDNGIYYNPQKECWVKKK